MKEKEQYADTRHRESYPGGFTLIKHAPWLREALNLMLETDMVTALMRERTEEQQKRKARCLCAEFTEKLHL